MNTCRTCKFYTHSTAPWPYENDGACANEAVGSIFDEHTPVNGIAAKNESLRWAPIRIGPDFGCIHYEPKEEQRT